MGILGRAKDAMLERAALSLLRPRIERYGELRSLSLDTTARRISAEVMLRGDPDPLIIREASYRIEQQGSDRMAVVYGIKTSKEWVQNLLDDHFPELRFRLPETVASLI